MIKLYYIILMNTKKLKKNKTKKTNKRVKKNKIQRNSKMKQKGGQGGLKQLTNYHELSDQHKLGVEDESEIQAINLRRERQKLRQLESLKENLKICEQKRKDDLQKIKLWLQGRFSDLGF